MTFMTFTFNPMKDCQCPVRAGAPSWRSQVSGYVSGSIFIRSDRTRQFGTLSGRSNRRFAADMHECRHEPTIGAGRPRSRPPWWDRLEGIPPVVRLASHGAPSSSMGRWTEHQRSAVADWTDRRRNVGIPTYTHCKPCRASPRYRGQTRTNGLLGKLIRRLDAGQFFMAGVSFSSHI